MSTSNTQRRLKIGRKALSVKFLKDNNIEYEEFNMGNHFILFHPAEAQSPISFWPTTSKWTPHGKVIDGYDTSSFEDLKRYMKDNGFIL